MAVGVLLALYRALGRALTHENGLLALAELFEVDPLGLGGGELPSVGQDVVHRPVRVFEVVDQLTGSHMRMERRSVMVAPNTDR